MAMKPYCILKLGLLRSSHSFPLLRTNGTDEVLWMNNLYTCCGLLGNLTIKHHVFVYPAEIIEQTCAFLTQTKRLPLWCPSVLFMLTVVMETDYTLWIKGRAKLTQTVWTGPNSGPVYPSRAQCRSPAVQTPVTSGRPAQVQIFSRTLM